MKNRFLLFLTAFLVVVGAVTSCDDGEVATMVADDAQPSVLSIAVVDSRGQDLLTDEMISSPFAANISLEYCQNSYAPIWDTEATPMTDCGLCDPLVGRPEQIDRSWRPATPFSELRRVKTTDGYRLNFGGFDNTTAWRRRMFMNVAVGRTATIDIENRIENRNGKATAVRYISVDNGQVVEGDVATIVLGDDDITCDLIGPGNLQPEVFVLELVDAQGENLLHSTLGAPGITSLWGTEITIESEEKTERLEWDNIGLTAALRRGYDWPSPLNTPEGTPTLLDAPSSGITFATPTLLGVAYFNDYERISSSEHVIVFGGYLNGHHELTVTVGAEAQPSKVTLDIDANTIPRRVTVAVDGQEMPDNVARIPVY